MSYPLTRSYATRNGLNLLSPPVHAHAPAANSRLPSFSNDTSALINSVIAQAIPRQATPPARQLKRKMGQQGCVEGPQEEEKEIITRTELAKKSKNSHCIPNFHQPTAAASAAAASKSENKPSSPTPEELNAPELLSLTQDEIGFDLEEPTAAASAPKCADKLDSALLLLKGLSADYNERLALKLKLNQHSPIKQDASKYLIDLNAKIESKRIALKELLEGEQAQARSALIYHIFTEMQAMDHFSETAYVNFLDMLVGFYPEFKQLLFKIALKTTDEPRPVFTVSSIKIILNHLQSINFFKADKSEYDAFPSYATLIEALKALPAEGDLQRFFIVQQNDPEKLTEQRNNGCHVFPMYLQRKQGKCTIVITDSTTMMMQQANGMQISPEWMKGLIKLIMKNIPCEIILVKDGRQSDCFSCPIFSILDLYAIAHDPKKFMQHVESTTILAGPQLNPDGLNFKFFKTLPKEMYFHTQSLQKIQSYIEENHIQESFKQRFFKFSKSVQTVVEVPLVGHELQMKEQNIKVRRRFRTFMPIIFAHIAHLKPQEGS